MIPVSARCWLGIIKGQTGQGVLPGHGNCSSSGKTLVNILMDGPDRSSRMQIARVEQVVQAYIANNGSFTLRTVLGDVIYDRATDRTYFTGELAGEATGNAADPLGIGLAFTGSRPSGIQGEPTEANCYRNCFYKGSKKLAFKGILRAMVGLPPLSESDMVEAANCEIDCKKDPTSHYCQTDNYYCDAVKQFFDRGAVAEHRIMKQTCDTETGLYEPTEEYIRSCSYAFPRQKCIYGPNNQPRCVNCEKEDGLDFNEVAVSTPKDPNAKYGPAGDLLPGEVVSYTVTYENVGEGIAYGVYVEDRLSEHFDESTLVIGQGGLYLPTSRTILWEIGELGPKGSPTASGLVTFTVQLRTGLPGGTPILNQAVVYFPSAPEETPTNPVVNVIWPVVEEPLTVTVMAGHSVPITLSGRDTGQGPLTFQVVDPPGRGTLTGSAPNLTYTAPAGFTGQELFTFTASNAITESRLAEVTVLVVPDPTDITPPAVAWTAPTNHAIVDPISSSPAFTDTLGPVYTPYMILGFSEAIDSSTVTTATLLLTRQDGTPIPVTVDYSQMAGEAILYLRQPLEPGIWYTVRATQGVKDLMGNPLAADFVWTFRTAGGGMIYVPLLVRTP